MTQSLLLPPAAVPVPDVSGLIAAELEETEKVLARTLRSRYAAVASVVEHVRHYRGKRLRPVVLLLTASARGPTGNGSCSCCSLPIRG